MSFSKKTQKKINQAAARAKAKLKYLLIGPQGCTPAELKDLARIGFIGKVKTDAPLIRTYLEQHELNSSGDVAPEEVTKDATDFLHRIADRYATKAADQMKADILSTIDNTVGPIRDKIGTHALPAPEVAKDLKDNLKDTVDNWQNRFGTIARTELNRAANWGAMDSILNNNPQKEAHEINVYKIGNPAGQSCPYCLRFWFLDDGITPRVYRMSELMGKTNIGRKKQDWVPTIDPTHPNESHMLRELQPGFGFENGELSFISLKHDEWKKQRGFQ